jgi:Kef-type K+ transport system membrane component KefB
MHEYDVLLFELFAIFVAAKVIGEIFERLKLPAVLGKILAGVLPVLVLEVSRRVWGLRLRRTE